jgi:hypothetical protein
MLGMGLERRPGYSRDRTWETRIFDDAVLCSARTIQQFDYVTERRNRLPGCASTNRVHPANPPMTGTAYLDGTDWRAGIGLLAAPRIAIIQDLDRTPGGGVITNGAVRDLPAVSKLDFPMFTPFADCHVVVSVPLSIAAELPETPARIRSKEKRIMLVSAASPLNRNAREPNPE